MVSWSPKRSTSVVDSFLRRPAFDAEAEASARLVLADVKKNGDRALVKYAKKYDGVLLKAKQIRVSSREIKAASGEVDAAFKRAAKEAHKRITRFSKEGLRKGWALKTARGGSVGERFLPLERIGVYIPGGEAPLVSTALMTATLAKVAGVPEIIACTPSNPDGSVNPFILYVMQLAGVTEIYRIGGIQAIGAMAYGTKTIERVKKIVGPGGPYVTAAKRLVYGEVDLDLVAGPSEICVVADASSNPAYVAARHPFSSGARDGSRKSAIDQYVKERCPSRANRIDGASRSATKTQDDRTRTGERNADRCR